MPAPAICIVTGIIYDANGNPKVNTSLVIYMPQQVINQVSVVASQIISTQTDSNGAIAPIALPQTAIVSVTVGAGMPVTGIVPASATGDISALLTGTVFASPLSGATVQANGVNLASQLLLNFQSSNGVLVQNTSAGNIAFKSAVLAKDASEPAVSNSAIETNLYLLNVPANSLGTSNWLHGRVGMIITSILNGATLTPRLFYGANTLYIDAAGNFTGSTQGPVGYYIDFQIHNRNAAGIQQCEATGFLATTDPNHLYIVAPGLSTFTRFNQIAVNSTLDESIQLNVLWSGADPLNSVSGVGMHLWPMT